MLLTILIALSSIMSLLIVHEFGHFVIAKRFGVKVEEFGVGFPPRLFGRKFGETVYSLNLLPIGAFVKIAGEEGEDSSVENYRSFRGKTFTQKMLIILGGVVTFWIMAAILLSFVFWMGAPQAISDDDQANLVNPKVHILAVAPGSPAELGGIKTGDAILRVEKPGIEAKDISKVKEVQAFAEANKGERIIVRVQRGGDVMDISLTPRVSSPPGEGVMGISLARTAEKSYPWWQAPLKGIEATANLTQAVFVGWGQILGNLFQGAGLPQGAQLVGPIGIGVLINQAAQVGFVYFLQFIAIIAVYLAVFNILPIPALDGGKMLFLIIEKIKGSPINQRAEQAITTVFFAILIALMIFVTIQDVIKLF